MTMRTCVVCSKPLIEGIDKRTVTCGYDCGTQWAHRHSYTKKCLTCGDEMTTSIKRKLFCGWACWMSNKIKTGVYVKERGKYMKKVLLSVLLMLLTISNARGATTPPSSVTAITMSASKIALAWSAPSGTHGFYIERSKQIQGPYVIITALPGSARRFGDFGLTAETIYYYRIQAYRDNVLSIYSNVVQATTFPLGQGDVTINFSPIPSVQASLPAVITANVFVDGLRPSDALEFLWSQKSGPTPSRIDQPTALSTSVIFGEAGTYVLTFTVNVVQPTGIVLVVNKTLESNL